VARAIVRSSRAASSYQRDASALIRTVRPLIRSGDDDGDLVWRYLALRARRFTMSYTDVTCG